MGEGITTAQSSQEFAPDRSKADWPSSEAEADKLWLERIKFDIINQMLGYTSKSHETDMINEAADEESKIPQEEPLAEDKVPQTYEEKFEKAKAEVVLNGTNMYRHYKEMQYDIGFVPQLDLMRGSDSVFRTLMDAASLRLPKDFTVADRKARVEDVMNIFGLTPVENHMVDKLSGGQRKRLSIAMEFISNPSLFILDEPDSGLDGVMARELFEQLRLIADQGKIIIVITHTPDRVIDLFDDVIVLAKDAKHTGRLAYFGSIDGARAFFGKESMEEIVKSVNRQEEGGEGRADEFILKYAEVQHG